MYTNLIFFGAMAFAGVMLYDFIDVSYNFEVHNKNMKKMICAKEGDLTLKRQDLANFCEIKKSYYGIEEFKRIHNMLFGNLQILCEEGAFEFSYKYEQDLKSTCEKCHGVEFMTDNMQLWKVMASEDFALNTSINVLHGNNCHWFYPELGIVKDVVNDSFYLCTRYSYETTYLYEIEIDGVVRNDGFPAHFEFDLDSTNQFKVITRKYMVRPGTGEIDTVESHRWINPYEVLYGDHISP